MSSTRAALLTATGHRGPYAETRPLAIETVELDSPGYGEVRVRIHAAGLCHSDLSVINGDRVRPTPMALGHEAAAEVVELGAGVTDLSVGDRVVLVFVPSCGSCLPCMEGRPALCEPGAAANTSGTLLGGSRRLHHHGADVHHHLGCSAFADYAVVSRRSCVKVMTDISYTDLALFGCAVLTGVGAVVNTARVPMGASVAVVGLGGVGQAALLGAVASGARQVIAVDFSEAKLDQALELGATHVVNAGNPQAADVVRTLSRAGVDFAFEMAGSPAALELAYRCTRRGGTTVTAGLPNPTQLWSVPPVHLVAEERTIKGSYIGSAVPGRDIPRYIALYEAGKLPVNRLLSGVCGFDGLNAAFDALASGQAVRQVLLPASQGAA